MSPTDARRPVAAAPTIDPAESPLAWLRARRGRDGAALIEETEFLAGERLREDHAVGSLLARTTMNWEAFGTPSERRSGGAGGGLAISDAAMAARARVARALESVGPDFAGLLVAVCCEGRGLQDVEREHGWPLRSGKVILRLALAALARHYGYDRPAVGPDRAPIRRWATPDARPRP